MDEKIQMVDLKGQYNRIKGEIDSAISDVIRSCSFINGHWVGDFAGNLAGYLGVKHVIPCGNGTDALQIALMSLGLKPGDEVIVPSFTYVATAEVIGLLGLVPVLVDVDRDTFNIDPACVEQAITEKTRAIVPVHLFGQSCDMAPVLEIAERYSIPVVEDNAQALGAEYTFSRSVGRFLKGDVAKCGTMGIFGCTSFFPSKNLGCYGDGGAIMTNNDELASLAKMVANHGQKIKYHHSVIGCNSRLDSIQAAILDVKLKYLDGYCKARGEAARYYTARLKEIDPHKKILCPPVEMECSTHVYHQYTLRVNGGLRDELQQFLRNKGIPSMIYYPLSLEEQEAFSPIARVSGSLARSGELAASVLSLPIHTEMTPAIQKRILAALAEFVESR